MIERFKISPTQFLALLYLLIACFVLSFSPISVRWSEQEISPGATILDRYLFAAIILSIRSIWDFFQAKNNSEQPILARLSSRKILLLLVGTGIFSSSTQLLWAWSLTQTKVATSALIHSLTPLFLTLFAWIFLNRSFDRQFLIGMAIALSASIAIGIGDLQIATTQLQGDLLSLFSAILLGGYLLIVEQLRQYLSVSNILLWCCLFSIFLLLPVLLMSGEPIFPDSRSGWLAIICLALTFVIGHGIMANILKIFSSSIVAIVLLIEPFLISIEARFFFAEKLSISEFISFFIILFGIYLAVSSPRQEVSK
ncbi:DMT family transporter [Dapis sp. BLCC M229]|uniref:DMT family transporter n=1 Tax=Dapis sp. BLCC M229 TaxID=3400188 RepID=UPI003CFAAB88